MVAFEAILPNANNLELALCLPLILNAGTVNSMAQLLGSIERVTFHNAENGYCVLRVVPKGKRDVVTVVGNAPTVNPGEEISATGEWIHDESYGSQFRAKVIAIQRPSTEEGIIKYLGSSLIDGIGPTYARKLVDKFGAEIFEIIEKKSARLEEVPGVGAKRRQEIKASWEKQKSINQIMIFLHQHGINTTRAVRIFKTYGEESVEVLEKNPWQLARDIPGIGFKTADEIAGKLGLSGDHPARVEAGLFHVLLSAGDQGHCALPVRELVAKTSEALGVVEDLVEAILQGLCRAEKLFAEQIEGVNLIFPPHLQRAEVRIARKLRELASLPPAFPRIEVMKALEWCEKKTGKSLAEGQKNAIATALQNRITVITGGPGVGKTTILNSLLLILRAKGVNAVLAAPTGRAARRLAESTGMEAKTIHRLLEVEGANRFARNEHHPLEGDLFVIDESSMIDVSLMNHLVSAFPKSAHAIFVGDVDQLPSVGPGSVLADLIESGVCAVARLTEIFRQAEESQIITNAHAINRGEVPVPSNSSKSDFFLIEKEEVEAIPSLIIRLMRGRLQERFGLDPMSDVQVLAPMHRGSLGVRALNVSLQGALNPPSPTKFEMDHFGVTFRDGDRVIQTKNNYDKEVFNGDLGRIAEITTDPGKVKVRFEDGRTAEYAPGELDELSLAYAITIHKSQGSEFPVVIIPIATQQFVLLQRNLLYTGVTRGKQLVILIGQKKALGMAVRNNDSKERWRGLHWRLRQA